MKSNNTAETIDSSDVTSKAPPTQPDEALLPPTGKAQNYSEGQTIYVDANSLNGRSAPSETGTVIHKLRHGQDVKVIERSGDWVKVASVAGAVWIASRHTAKDKPAPKPKYSAQPQRFMGPSQKPSKSRYYSDDNCPCNGSKICIGPRGGRYCITSGGNKRYGV